MRLATKAGDGWALSVTFGGAKVSVDQELSAGLSAEQVVLALTDAMSGLVRNLRAEVHQQQLALERSPLATGDDDA